MNLQIARRNWIIAGSAIVGWRFLWFFVGIFLIYIGFPASIATREISGFIVVLLWIPFLLRYSYFNRGTRLLTWQVIVTPLYYISQTLQGITAKDFQWDWFTILILIIDAGLLWYYLGATNDLRLENALAKKAQGENNVVG